MKRIAIKLGMTALMMLALLAGWMVGQGLFAPSPAKAAQYWSLGVRSQEISLCFAGNSVNKRPDRVQEIVEHLQQFEYTANIRFLTLDGTSIQNAVSKVSIHKLSCPAPTWVNGKSYYDGDIRVALWHTNVPTEPPGMVPGVGCSQPLKGTSWSNPPSELTSKRPCQYNLKLGDDDTDMTGGRPGVPTGTPWLNHTLHEFGHALGLGHEHARTDENAHCVLTSQEYHTVNSGHITPYDKNSVMHYRFWPDEVPQCSGQTGTNYSNAGFTPYDKLALHIMYPETNRVAELTGKTVVKTGEPLILRSTWVQQGATSFAVKNFRWRLSGFLMSIDDTLNMTFDSPGVYTIQFSYQDFLDRSYSSTRSIRVLDAATFDRQMAAVQEAQLYLMSSMVGNNLYLPAVSR
ncbi:MAG: hypothetical protein GXP38_05360 [Chloroflexi bacterium]|nr:hypothetical protein [Chloroflexota bacterium]